MTKENNPYEIISSYAEENNLIYGIGSAEPFYDLKPILEKSETPFISSSAEERINPKFTLSTAKSIICLGLSYNKKYNGKFDGEIRGNLSVGAVGEDYHIILSRHLANLCKLLNIDEIYFADTGPLVDRAVAFRCGLGQYGKHFSIINPKIGSMFFIGYILTELDLAPTKSYNNLEPCKDCDLCIKSCPGGAIKKDFLDYSKCISFLTQSKELSTEDYKLINKQIYGCDICQKVCPYNKPTELCENIDEFYPKIDDILSMSNREFSLRFKNTAAGWRGKKIIQRNAIIALSNIKNNKSLDILLKYRNDNRDDIKNLIEWAINKLKD